MSNQDMQFVDPDWGSSYKPGEGLRSSSPDEFRLQLINREESQKTRMDAPSATVVRDGPPLESPFYTDLGPKQTPLAPQSHRMPRKKLWRPWLIVAIILIVVISVGNLLGRYMYSNLVTALRNSSHTWQTFTVKDHPKIIIRGSNGHITLHGSDIKQVSITENSHLDSSKPAISYDQGTNSLRIDGPTDTGNGAEGSPDATMDINLPQNADIDVDTNLGQIELNDLHGTINIGLGSGSVIAHNVQLSNGSDIQTTDGPLTFDGSTDSGSSISFHTYRGTVDVTLPKNSSFTANAQTGIGRATSDFPGISHGYGTNSTLEGTNGEAGNSQEAAKITIDVNTGSIHLHSSNH